MGERGWGLEAAGRAAESQEWARAPRLRAVVECSPRRYYRVAADVAASVTVPVWTVVWASGGLLLLGFVVGMVVDGLIVGLPW